MIICHTPEEVLAISNKINLGRDLMNLKHKYKLPILDRIIDQLDHEVRMEIEKYSEYIGTKQIASLAIGHVEVTIDGFNFVDNTIMVSMHTDEKDIMASTRVFNS